MADNFANDSMRISNNAARSAAFQVANGIAFDIRALIPPSSEGGSPR